MPYWPLESRGRVSLLLENERTLVICIYCRRRCIAVSSITSCLFLSTSLLLGLCSLGWVIMEPTVGEPHVWENLAVAIVGFVILSPPSALECTRRYAHVDVCASPLSRLSKKCSAGKGTCCGEPFHFFDLSAGIVSLFVSFPTVSSEFRRHWEVTSKLHSSSTKLVIWYSHSTNHANKSTVPLQLRREKAFSYFQDDKIL